MSARLKSVFKALALTMISLIVSLAGLEFGVRAFIPQYEVPDETCITLDPALIFKLKPNCRTKAVQRGYNHKVVTNSKGLRDVERAYEKASRTVRILALGDSFTFGSAVEMDDAWPRVLERLLNHGRPTRRFEVINGGTFSYGTYHELAFLKTEGFKYSPDIVILQSYLWNDVFDNYDPYSRVTREEAERGKLGPMRRIKNRARKYSHTYRLIGDQWNLLLHVYGDQAPPNLFGIAWTRETGVGFKRTLDHISAMKRFCDERKIKLMVVDFPNKALVDDRVWARLTEKRPDGFNEFSRERPLRLLAEHLQSERIPFLSLTAVMKEQAVSDRLFITHDPHLNPAGYAFAAEHIRQSLVPAGWIPGSRRSSNTLRDAGEDPS